MLRKLTKRPWEMKLKDKSCKNTHQELSITEPSSSPNSTGGARAFLCCVVMVSAAYTLGLEGCPYALLTLSYPLH